MHVGSMFMLREREEKGELISRNILKDIISEYIEDMISTTNMDEVYTF